MRLWVLWVGVVCFVFPCVAGAQGPGWYACFAGQEAQCFEAGMDYFNGSNGVGRNVGFAILAWDHGCKEGDGSSCGALGFRRLDGQGANRSPREARAFFDKGCRMGGAHACHGVAHLLRKGLAGMGRDLNAANKIDNEACEQGDGAACYAMGYAYNYGEGVKAHMPTAKDYFAQACRYGISDACYSDLGASIAMLVDSDHRGKSKRKPRQAKQNERLADDYVDAMQGPRATSQGPRVASEPSSSVSAHPFSQKELVAAARTAERFTDKCYRKRARRVPSMRGTVDVSLTTDARGRVTQARHVGGTIADRWMQRCVTKQARRMRFRRASSGTHTFEF